jgi:hypothetical protein
MKKLLLLSSIFTLALQSCGGPEEAATDEMLRPTTVSAEVVKKVTDEIKATPNWFEDIKKSAEEKHAPIDSVLTEAATYYAKQHPSNYGLVKYSEAKLNEKIAAIKATPEWFAQLQESAKKENKSIEVVLHDAAVYVLDGELK